MKTAVLIIKDRRSQKYVAQCRTCTRRMELSDDGLSYQHLPHHKPKLSHCSETAALVSVSSRKYATT